LPKINSERCESVKLCHINRSSPVFFETQCTNQKTQFDSATVGPVRPSSWS